MLGEFDGKPPAGGPMQASQEAFDDAFGNELEAAQAGDFSRVEQIEPGWGEGTCGGGHAPPNVGPCHQ